LAKERQAKAATDRSVCSDPGLAHPAEMSRFLSETSNQGSAKKKEALKSALKKPKNNKEYQVSVHDFLSVDKGDDRPFLYNSDDEDDASLPPLCPRELDSDDEDDEVVTRVQYRVSNHQARSNHGALVDRGANGGIAGSDVRVIAEVPGLTVDVTGIDNHQMSSLKIVTAGGVTKTQRGNIIVILNQYAYTGRGKTIHSCGQIEWHKNEVHEKSMRVRGGLQHIHTVDGYFIPIDIYNGLPYAPMRPYTDEEWDTLPHVILTGDTLWDPSVLDNTISTTQDWYDGISDLKEGLVSSPFDHRGNYLGREANFSENMEFLKDMNGSGTILINRCERFVFDTNLDHDLDPDATMNLEVNKHERALNDVDYAALRPYFLNTSQETMEKTLQATTQFGRNCISGSTIRNTIKSPFPACNVLRRNEPVATDTVFSDTAAVDNGSFYAQFFVGRNSCVTDVYSMRAEKQFVNTLEDNIRKRGAMDTLLSDSARLEISERVKDILRALVINDWQSEPHYQHQNFAERKYRDVKAAVNWVLNSTGAPDDTWFLCLQYVCYVMNHTALKSIKWRTPLEVLNGVTPDISVIKDTFRFWDHVYILRYESGSEASRRTFPSKSNEISARFVGFSENVGHSHTFKVLTDDTKKILHRSRLRRADHDPNLCLNQGETP
jgi:hypothetical protein